MRHLVAIGLLLAITMPASAQTIVQHLPTGPDPQDPNVSITWCLGWSGANARNQPTLMGWGEASEGVAAAVFDKAALQTAIDNSLASYGGWDAHIIVTQLDWIPTEPPAGFSPIVGSADVGSSNGIFAYQPDGQSSHPVFGDAANWNTNSQGGRWSDDQGTVYDRGWNGPSFHDAVLAGVTRRASQVEYPSWSYYWWTDIVGCYNVVMDCREELIEHYINSNALLLFAGGVGDAWVEVFGAAQWGGAADIRVRISQPPQTAPWIYASPNSFDLMMSLDDPVSAPQTVTVTNPGTGALSWTAAEAPDQTWISLTNASGSDGDSFQITLDVSTLTPGDYAGKIEVSDAAASNSPVDVWVDVSVFATQSPQIELVPDALAIQAPASDPIPPSQAVTVNNVSFGTLAWTATPDPNAAWLSVTNGSGSDGDSFDVHVDATGLSLGVYSSSVAVTDPNASNSPQTLPVTLYVQDQDADIDKANSYDDGWETGPDGWVTNCKAIHAAWVAGGIGSDGFLVRLGDSITYANPSGQWARYGAGKTADDIAICNWTHAGAGGTGNVSVDGWYLAYVDMPGGRSYTAESGITTGQYLTGGADLPSMDEMYTAGFTNPDGKQYRDAEIATILLGTNDASGNRPISEVETNLEAIADKLLANNIIPILIALPPKRSDMTDVNNYNAAIYSLAERRKWPLIDFCEEVLRRRPGTTWDGTLISGDGVHPSASYDGFTPTSNPYANNGEALSNSGYLLYCWLTVQKIKEVKAKVIDAGAAQLFSSEPTADGTLPKTQNNVILLTFDGPITMPAGQPISIFGGGFEEGAAFTYSIEPDGVTLKAVEQGPMLTDLTWYQITPAELDVDWFTLDVCTLQGDANGNARVTTADYVTVKDHMGVYTDARYDLNGNGRVTTADYIVVKDNMGKRQPLKP
ncbi:MAG TPA: GDSL-type esterase/lipase family protein [Phycisphaerae bacterium]|nr:GDSL-type esterase/lipase family protein [Phycisphaerae bacterium]